MRLLSQKPGDLKARLEVYLDQDARYKAVYDYTKKCFEEAKHLTAHNWAHAYRDTLNAIVIGEAEGADMSIVLPAITMHDIGFLYGASGDNHGAVGADNLADFLKSGNIAYPGDKLKKIAECISTHKGSRQDKKPESLEAKVVADADLLEKFGPFGVYQQVRTMTEFNVPLEHNLESGSKIHSTTLETETGKKLAEPGRQFVADFYQELAEANEPYTSE